MCRRFELHVGEAVVVVEEGDIIAVGCDIRIAVGLVRHAAQQPLQPFLRVAVAARDLQRIHQGLRTFLDLNKHRNLVLLAVIVLLQVRVHLDLQKAVGLVKVFDGL